MLHVRHEDLGRDLAHGDQFPSTEEPDADEPSHDPVAESKYTGLLVHDGRFHGLFRAELGDLADLADQPIAETVRACTTDRSVPEPDRIVQAANKLTPGADTGRLVELAGLASPAAINHAHADWRLDRSRRVRIWSDHARHLAGVYACNLTPPDRGRASRLDRALKALDEIARAGMAEVDGRVGGGWEASVSSLASGPSRANPNYRRLSPRGEPSTMTRFSRINRVPGGGPLPSGGFPSGGWGAIPHAVPQPDPTSVDVRRSSQDGPTVGRPHPRGYPAPRASPERRRAPM